MTEIDLLNAILDDAEESVRLLEAAPRRTPFREGALAGLSDCRRCGRDGLATLLTEAVTAREALPRTSGDPGAIAAYWYARSREAQIAWVIDVFHAADVLTERSDAPYSARAGLAAAAILGVARA